MSRYMPVNETWIHWYIIETKDLSNKLTSPANMLRRSQKMLYRKDDRRRFLVLKSGDLY